MTNPVQKQMTLVAAYPVGQLTREQQEEEEKNNPEYVQLLNTAQVPAFLRDDLARFPYAVGKQLTQMLVTPRTGIELLAARSFITGQPPNRNELEAALAQKPVGTTAMDMLHASHRPEFGNFTTFAKTVGIKDDRLNWLYTLQTGDLNKLMGMYASTDPTVHLTAELIFGLKPSAQEWNAAAEAKKAQKEHESSFLELFNPLHEIMAAKKLTERVRAAGVSVDGPQAAVQPHVPEGPGRSQKAAPQYVEG